MTNADSDIALRIKVHVQNGSFVLSELPAKFLFFGFLEHRRSSFDALILGSPFFVVNISRPVAVGACAAPLFSRPYTGRNLPLMAMRTRSPLESGSRLMSMLKSMALLMPSPNCS